MKSILTLLLLAFFPQSFITYGQEVLVGKVTSCKDKKPLAFANIVLAKDFSGTTSDENGEYHLKLQSSKSNDSIAVSYIGFKAVKLPVATVIKNGAVCLEDATVVLREVVVSTKQLDRTKLFEKFRLIKGDLYAQESETSIGEFNLFLKEMEGTPSCSPYHPILPRAFRYRQYYQNMTSSL